MKQHEKKSELIQTNPAFVLQNDSQTPLHIAVASEDQTLVDYFVTCDAKSDIPDNVSIDIFVLTIFFYEVINLFGFMESSFKWKWFAMTVLKLCT